MKRTGLVIIFLTIFLTIPPLIAGQTKKRKTTRKAPAEPVKTTPTPTTTPQAEETPVKTVTKRNERPVNESPKTSQNSIVSSVYFYEFFQSQFLITQIFIEHDGDGNGKITFMKQDFEEAVSDPIRLSQASLEKVKSAFAALDFLNSTENYQDAERNYGHLGELKVKMKKDGRERVAAFNWTQNKDAKMLQNEYRKIANQFIWMFDVSVARRNQPLETPGLMDALDSYMKRDEISDPLQMIPFLTQLTNDERIPLIARNHAARLIKEIEKKAEKEKAKAEK